MLRSPLNTVNVYRGEYLDILTPINTNHLCLSFLLSWRNSFQGMALAIAPVPGHIASWFYVELRIRGRGYYNIHISCSYSNTRLMSFSMVFQTIKKAVSFQIQPFVNFLFEFYNYVVFVDSAFTKGKILGSWRSL